MQQVCQIWSEVLGLPVDKVGIHDDFFKLGGNSILAIRLVSRLNKALVTRINVAIIFKQNTILKLVDYLEQDTGEGQDNVLIPVSHVKNPSDNKLSFAQERLWFIDKFEQGTNAYNIPLMFKLENSTDIEVLKQSIHAVVSRHDILHTIIREDADGVGYQVIVDTKQEPLLIRELKLNNEDKYLISQSGYNNSIKYNIRKMC